MTDYMNEAERLISAHEWAIRQHDRGAEWDDAPEKTLAALLAHIQRGAVPEGWREDVYLAAQMLTWADDDGGLTDQQDRAIRAHQKKMFAMLAAAPDLLSALVEAVELIETISPMEGDTLRRARSAIEKAVRHNAEVTGGPLAARPVD